tara:strand:+ start:1007 stop:1915 length:909 start_codon:yes stop_codon:yes gene_type:complete
MQNIEKLLLTRKTSKISSIIKPLGANKVPIKSTIVLTSSCDKGVQRNGGRLGSRLGPKSVIFELGKMELTGNNTQLYTKEVSSDLSDFDKSQECQTKLINELIVNQDGSKFIHLGGGHDHVFSLLSAIGKKVTKKKLVILNVDAHLDTRIDDWSHSGTPFRQFDKFTSSPYQLIQLGCHRETNNKDNYQSLKNGSMEIMSFRSKSDLVSLIKYLGNFKPETHEIILSVDCDGLDLSDIPAVSAPNPYGTHFEQLISLIDYLQSDWGGISYCGFYELNPLLDTLSNHSSKKIAWALNRLISKT